MKVRWNRFFTMFVLSNPEDTMRKTCLIILLMHLCFSAMSQTAWTVETVPNTRLQGNDIHVSDPDGFLSDSAEMRINTALCAIRDKADVFLVTLASIGDAESKPFATELFNYWGIGDAETDNGVLLLFVEDQHSLEFETAMAQRKPSLMQSANKFSPIPSCLISALATTKADFVPVSSTLSLCMAAKSLWG